MEKQDFLCINETMQTFNARKGYIIDQCKAECAKIQREADLKKNKARESMNDELIALAQEQDAFLAAYRQWKRDNPPTEA